MAVKTSFKALASGTAVMEALSPVGMEEMVTLYSIDGDGIALVHYCPTNLAPPLQMETVANLDVEFARVQVVSSAEGKAVVEQDAAIGDVQRLNVYRELLTETLSE